jgi:hypothetical protein
VDVQRAPEPLLEGAVLASHMVRTFAPAAGELRRFLQGEAESLRASFVGRSLPTCARLLSEQLTCALGFRGAEAGRLDMDHVLLDRVIEHGWVAVAVAGVLLVGRWAGLIVTGVGMPDHFRCDCTAAAGAGGSLPWRPLITKADCVRYLRSIKRPCANTCGI